MTMHLSNVRVNYKSKNKKYKSAEHKKKELEAQKIQDEMYKKWDIKPTKSKTSSNKKEFMPNYSYRDKENKVGSVELSGGIHGKKDAKQYSGDLVIGIAVMHKSCLQPVISQEQAEASAKMRRG